MEEKISAMSRSAYGRKIAIQAADLDHSRIDGTRVYIANLLKYFGMLDGESSFFIFHQDIFNPELAPPKFSNYNIVTRKFPFLWTQTVFAWSLWRNTPDVVWMPMAALPFLRRKRMKTVVTIHDLAFKHFPETFPVIDRLKLNFFANYAIRNADKLIAVSESTKKDILHFYPQIDEKKIQVIRHGFTQDVFGQERDLVAENNLKQELGIEGEYMLYSGALQPRKNIQRLIMAYDAYRKKTQSKIKLVLAGEKAWLGEGIIFQAQKSSFAKDIVMPGRIKFCDIGHLFRGASVFVYPSLYEGFGIPVLEAFAAKVPLIVANNSSLPEVAGEAALYFDALDVGQLAEQIEKVLTQEELRNALIASGEERLQYFSWKKCAQETLEFIKS
jgi:glycosyltransferase involved in cell wall biosynthesis